MSTVVVKAVLVNTPHKMARKWLRISGVVYVAYAVFVGMNAVFHDFEQNWIHKIMFWTLWGALLTCCGYSAVADDNTNHMCFFGYCEFVLAIAYSILLLYVWDETTVYKNMCESCNFQNSTEECIVCRAGVFIELSEDICAEAFDIVGIILLSGWLSLLTIIHMATSYWSCKAMHHRPSQMMWATATEDMLPYAVTISTPQTRPSHPVEP